MSFYNLQSQARKLHSLSLELVLLLLDIIPFNVVFSSVCVARRISCASWAWRLSYCSWTIGYSLPLMQSFFGLRSQARKLYLQGLEVVLLLLENRLQPPCLTYLQSQARKLCLLAEPGGVPPAP